VNKTKIGLKFYSNRITASDANKVADRIDFIELMCHRDTRLESLGFLKRMGLEINVHNMHLEQGVNISNPGRRGENLDSLLLSSRMADYFGSKYIVVHPGEKERAECAMDNSIGMFIDQDDKRMLVENMPFENKTRFFCTFPEETRIFMKAAGCGLCLDIGHATAAAFGMKRNYLKTIKDFLALKPCYFHLQDTRISSNKDCHLHFGQGELDLPRIFKLLPRGAMLCIETEKDIKGRLGDIEFLRNNL
jgi:deoxyribonuclease-4